MANKELSTIGAVTQTTAAAVLGFRSPGSLRALNDAPRLANGRYDLCQLVPWYLARQAGGDDLMGGSESPGLERYREARASLAELELAQREHQLVSVEQARAVLLRWAAVIKRAGERLRKRQLEAHRTLAEALVECAKIVDELAAKS